VLGKQTGEPYVPSHVQHQRNRPIPSGSAKRANWSVRHPACIPLNRGNGHGPAGNERPDRNQPGRPGQRAGLQRLQAHAKQSDAPSSVTVITADEIQKYGYRTLADILRSVCGFDITYERNFSYLGVRDINRPEDYNSRVLLLIDGQRINITFMNKPCWGRSSP
jgi:TonB-dependent Receptor Plug Domain